MRIRMTPLALGLGLLSLSACRPAEPPDTAEAPPEAPAEPSPEARGEAPVAPCGAAEVAGAARDSLTASGKQGVILALDLQTGTELARVESSPGLATASVPPASTVKPILALAGLRAGAVTADTSFTCGGEGCFAKHGPLNAAGGIATSCNVYFHDLVGQAEPAAFASEFRRLGLTGLADAVAGAASDDARYAAAIGHGDARVTVESLARAYAGLLATDAPGMDVVKAGMVAAVAEERGSGRSAAIPGLAVGGKTGTDSPGTDTPDDGGGNHAWFVSYAPAENPRVLVVVYLRGDGTGPSISAPAAKPVLSAWSGACAGEAV